MEKISETERLVIKEVTYEDFDNLSVMLKDLEVMYAWEHSFSDEEVKEWIDNNIKSYREDGTGYFTIIEKESGRFAGQAGLHYSVVGDKRILEIGYIFMKEFWNKGYAYEAAKFFIKQAFHKMKEKEIYALIRLENYRSSGLAEKLGFNKISSFVKRYKEKDMIHDIYILSKDSK